MAARTGRTTKDSYHYVILARLTLLENRHGQGVPCRCHHLLGYCVTNVPFLPLHSGRHIWYALLEVIDDGKDSRPHRSGQR